MTQRETLSLAGSILVHLAVVFFLGASLVSPPRILNRVEIDLEGAKSPESDPGAQVPTPSKAPPMPQATALPTSTVVPLKISRPQEVAPAPLPVEPDGVLAAPDPTALPGPPAVAMINPSLPASPAGGAAGSGQGKAGSGRGSALEGYYAAVRQRVDDAKQYPQMAQQRRIQGQVVVAFGLTLDGHLTGDPKLVKSCGYGLLDSAALRAVRRGAPYPQFPGKAEDLKDMEVEVTFVLR
ncbi:MAG: energy transducer TonB [Syntrophotaleaceae bacterium]